jgi:hypothetical protein
MRPTFHVHWQMLARQHIANDERLNNSTLETFKAARNHLLIFIARIFDSGVHLGTHEALS